MVMDPKQIARLVSEDISVNNGLSEAVAGTDILEDWDALNDRLEDAKERYADRAD